MNSAADLIDFFDKTFSLQHHAAAARGKLAIPDIQHRRFYLCFLQISVTLHEDTVIACEIIVIQRLDLTKLSIDEFSSFFRLFLDDF